MIRASNVKGTEQTRFTNGNHTSLADVPVEKGGHGDGFGPHELLEAALATCMAITARKYADKYALALDEVICELTLDRSDPGRMAVLYSIDLQGDLNYDQKRQVQEAVSNCPVYNSISGSFTMRPAQ
jgi:putative redox protein